MTKKIKVEKQSEIGSFLAFIFTVILFIILVVAAVIQIRQQMQQERDCESRHGTLISTYSGYVCIDKIP